MNKKWIVSVLAVQLLLTGCQSKSSPAPAAASKPITNTSANTSSTEATNTNTSTTNSQGSANPSSTAPANPYVVAVHQQSTVMDVTYPQFRGISEPSVQTQMNSVLKQAAVYHPDSSSSNAIDLQMYTATYAIAFKQGNLIDILIETYTMPKGAAHGMPAIASFWFNTQTGEQYTASELFQSGSNYLSRISQIVKGEDTAGKLDSFQTFTGVTTKDGFVLQPDGFCVYFSPYEWASFADGFLAYPVSFQPLNNVVNRQSPIWQALQSPSAVSDNKIQNEDIAKIRSLGYTAQTASTNGHLSLSAFAATPTADGQSLYAFTVDRSGTEAQGDEEKVFFFLDGKYLGTDTAKRHGPVLSMAANGLGSITVDDSINQSPYKFEIAYHWNGTRLVPNASFPAAYNEWK